MKRKISLIMAIAALSIFLSGNAFAAWSFDIKTDYQGGDAQATFNLSLNLEDSAILNSYNFYFIYDQVELDYLSSTHTPPAGYFPSMFGQMQVDESSGKISLVNAGAFVPSTIAAGSYNIASFTYDVISEVEDGITDFNFDFEAPMFKYSVDGVNYSNNSFAPSNLTDIAPSTASVPVPSAVWLFGSGIAGLACLRRKRA